VLTFPRMMSPLLALSCVAALAYSGLSACGGDRVLSSHDKRVWGPHQGVFCWTEAGDRGWTTVLPVHVGQYATSQIWTHLAVSAPRCVELDLQARTTVSRMT